MNDEDVFDDWERGSAAVLWLAAAPLIAVGLIAWAVARALGVSTP